MPQIPSTPGTAARAGVGTLIAIVAALSAVEAQAFWSTSKNKGTLCVSRTDPQAGQSATHFEMRPAFRCLSSSCTRVLQKKLNVEVGDGVISVTSLFRVTSKPGVTMCSRDCSGGGYASRVLPPLEKGKYRIELGGVEIGVLDTKQVPTDRFSSYCFGSLGLDGATKGL
ncbi:MAG: hypothetical protein HKO95_09920 [Rhodobacteraceae bacterium]|nr:hypothetical protein [Alphaproteobacteria bacterium]NNK67043.1 hypothetical protein [Paracoccaceae bacterium]